MTLGDLLLGRRPAGRRQPPLAAAGAGPDTGALRDRFVALAADVAALAEEAAVLDAALAAAEHVGALATDQSPAPAGSVVIPVEQGPASPVGGIEASTSVAEQTDHGTPAPAPSASRGGPGADR